jgi:hypothetical protein
MHCRKSNHKNQALVRVSQSHAHTFSATKNWVVKRKIPVFFTILRQIDQSAGQQPMLPLREKLSRIVVASMPQAAIS